jgi:hypothetical protein
MLQIGAAKWIGTHAASAGDEARRGAQPGPVDPRRLVAETPRAAGSGS